MLSIVTPAARTKQNRHLLYFYKWLFIFTLAKGVPFVLLFKTKQTIHFHGSKTHSCSTIIATRTYVCLDEIFFFNFALIYTVPFSRVYRNMDMSAVSNSDKLAKRYNCFSILWRAFMDASKLINSAIGYEVRQ